MTKVEKEKKEKIGGGGEANLMLSTMIYNFSLKYDKNKMPRKRRCRTAKYKKKEKCWTIKVTVKLKLK